MREPTEREWLEGIGERFEREHEDNRPHPVFVESVDVDAAWEVYYQLADRRHKDGLTLDQLRQVIEAALVGVVEAKGIDTEVCAGCGAIPHFDGGCSYDCEYDFDLDRPLRSTHRFVSPWVEVEEHQ